MTPVYKEELSILGTKYRKFFFIDTHEMALLGIEKSLDVNKIKKLAWCPPGALLFRSLVTRSR